MSLPSVLDLLTTGEKKKAHFMKPRVKTLCGDDSFESPAAEVLAVRQFTLKQNDVVPVHMHQEKEKLYYFYGPRTLGVTIIFDNNAEGFIMRPGNVLVIPAGCPHYVSYFPRKPATCKVLVIVSSQNAKDIAWQDDTDELVKNTHLL